MYFHSDLDLKDTYAICEVVVHVHDKNNADKLVTTLSMGLLAIKLTDGTGEAAAGKQAELQVYLTTPRIFMQFEEGQKVQNKLERLAASTYKLDVSVLGVEPPANARQLFQIVQSDCLIGHQDTVPGLRATPANEENRLPAAYHEKVVEEIQVARMAEVYAHNIELEHLGEIERIFRRWLEV